MLYQNCGKDNQDIINRNPKHKNADIKAVRALAQAAVNVELFTIPLYMTSMYSIQGMHQITGKNSLYQGRLWPGAAPVAMPQNASEQCFNIVFSVFIQEMLHLQIASNLVTALGKRTAEEEKVATEAKEKGQKEPPAISPNFNSPFLQNKQYGWICYGADKTVIPHIIDLQHTRSYKDVKVNLSELNENAIQLFLAIEEPIDIAKKELYCDEAHQDSYFPNVPFSHWTESSTEKNLPMFGSIGWMYECLASYLNIQYADGTQLFDLVFKPDSLQRDIFNSDRDGTKKIHPEYPQLDLYVTCKDSEGAKQQIFTMMSAITDQGEGSTLKIHSAGAGNAGHGSVDKNYQPDFTALKANNPAYNDKGCPVTSPDAHARYFGGVVDHYDRFQQVKGFLNSGDVKTWVDWHQSGYAWTPHLLRTEDYLSNPDLPSLEDVANALNDLKCKNHRKNFNTLSQVATGAIAGITTVLNKYWNGEEKSFPYPAMAGSGDRIGIFWAIFGSTPDLSLGIKEKHLQKDTLYHACQGLSFDKYRDDSCASQEIFHTCKGSNTCKGEGGCGFLHSNVGGGNCSSPNQKAEPPSSLYTAPADNRCIGFGGCAVPISASQLFPKDGKMVLYRLTGEEPEQIKNDKEEAITIDFKEGQPVYDVAWKAYSEVLKHQGEEVPEKPKPSSLRLAFPPST